MFLSVIYIENDFKGNGLTLGGGIETVLMENVTGKLEYRYTDYKTINVIDDVIGFGEPTQVVLDNDPSLQTVRAVVSYKLPVLDSLTNY